MPVISVLPENLINKIAAGEVIERPASVVKELVENSLDSGATRIDVDIEQGGKRLISVIDDGCGMSREDAELALERHATSKIAGEDDLDRIGTLGFRGEAIPSIASVCRFEVRSRPQDSESATLLEVEGGRLLRVEEASGPPGTRIQVRDLFYNVPVRRKFLKGDTTELKHILEWMVRQSLARTDVRFRVTHGPKTLPSAPATGVLEERVAAVLGTQIGEGMYPFQGRRGGVRLEGSFSRPDINCRGQKGIYLFINGRFVKDRSLSHACIEAYRGTLEKGRAPYVVAHLDVPSEDVDVNVHPQKTEVRFLKSNELYGLTLGALRTALSKSPWLKGGSGIPTKTVALGKGRPPGSPPAPGEFTDYRRKALEGLIRGQGEGADRAKGGDGPDGEAGGGREDDLRSGADRDGEGPWLDEETGDPAGRRSEDRGLPTPAVGGAGSPGIRYDGPWPDTKGQLRLDGSEEGSAGTGERPGFFQSLRFAGQVMGTYLVCEAPGRVVFIDQHAAHERIMFEQLKHEHRAGKVGVQRLLMPELVDLAADETPRCTENLERLQAVGLEVEQFGGNSFKVVAVPARMKESSPGQLLREVLEKIDAGPEDGSGSTEMDWMDSWLMTMACHSAVRAGRSLSEGEVRALLSQKDRVDFGGHCPHGRPVYFDMGVQELERRFKRG